MIDVQPLSIGRALTSHKLPEALQRAGRIVDGPQGCALCLLGVVRRAYQHANKPGVGGFRPTKASVEGGRDEVSPSPGDYSLMKHATHKEAEQMDAPQVLGMGRVAPKKECPMDPHERPVVTDDNKVAIRAGSTGNHVRYVLIASTALVIVCFIAIALFVKT
jgi:hypothetical protein